MINQGFEKLDKGKNLVVCSECGGENPGDSKFCNMCGAKFGDFGVEEPMGVQQSKKERRVAANLPEREAGKCPKCGNTNPAAAEFCFRCGARLRRGVGNLDGLVVIYLVGALYVLISLLFNSIVQASYPILVSYAVTGVLGLYMAYVFHGGAVRPWTKYLALVVPVLGIAGTGFLFFIGLSLRGIVGPAWIIFVLMLWKIWGDRQSI